MEYITVKLFKVSQESVYLDVIAECLCGYIFNKIEVGIRTYDHYGNALSENQYSLTDAILSEYDGNQTSEISARIPLSEFFGEGGVQPAIYTLTLGCIQNIIDDETNISQSIEDTEQHDTTVYTSDINGAFQYIMDNILNLENSCTPISDEAIRNYLILYGHLQALENGQQSIAEEYFKILVKNFTKSGNNSRACGGPCGCQSYPCGTNQHNQHPTHNSCNCNS